VSGSAFFTTTIPNIFAASSRAVLLTQTFRPLLFEIALREDLGFVDQCIAEDMVVDLDTDGRASDLIVTLYPVQQIEKGEKCVDQADRSGAVHLVLKEIPWHGWRPKYALLFTFAPEIPPIFV